MPREVACEVDCEADIHQTQLRSSDENAFLIISPFLSIIPSPHPRLDPGFTRLVDFDVPLRTAATDQR